MPDRAALVTGASSGIGLAIARVLGEEGYGLTVAARRPEKLTAAADGLREAGFEVEEVAANMADEAGIAAVAAAHRERWGRLDVLVNNAGVGIGAAVADIVTKRVDMQLDVNLRSVVLFYRECADLLRAAGAEHRNALVVNTSSISGKSGQPWLSVYSATKAAVIDWTQAMNKELNGDGIKSVALCPGFVDTDMTEFVREHVKPEDMIRTEDIARGRAIPAEDLAELRRARDRLPAAGRRGALRLGLHIGYWGLGMTAQEQLELVREAERLGYDSVWTAEAYGSDAVTILGWLAGQTERIKLGSAIMQMPGRSAAMTAMTAATLDQLSGGRMLLGIGTSGPQVAEGWHGQRFGRQLQRTREYLEVVRLALARKRRRIRRRDAAAAAARRPRQGAQAVDLTRAGADPGLHRGDRPQEHGADRRDRRRLAPDPVLARARGRVPAAARGGLRARGRRQGLRRVRHRPDRQRLRQRGPRRRARRDAAVSRALHRRHGLARAELLQPARAALRVRGRRRARCRSTTSTAGLPPPRRRCPAS